MRRILTWFFLTILFFAVVPPAHEYVHVRTCEVNGGEVIEINYWSHVVCGGEVENFPLFNKVNNLNDLVTTVFMIAYLTSITGYYLIYSPLRKNKGVRKFCRQWEGLYH